MDYEQFEKKQILSKIFSDSHGLCSEMQTQIFITKIFDIQVKNWRFRVFCVHNVVIGLSLSTCCCLRLEKKLHSRANTNRDFDKITMENSSREEGAENEHREHHKTWISTDKNTV